MPDDVLYLRDTDYWVSKRTGVLVPRGDYVPPGPDPDPDPDPPYDAELGTVGNRPALVSKPTAATTGPRASMLQTMNGASAIAAAKAAPDKTLRRVKVTSRLSLNGADTAGLIFEDCLFEVSGDYVVWSYFSSSAVPPAGAWPEFRYCEFRGLPYAGSTVQVGSHVRFLRCHLHHGTDIAKPYGNVEFYACLLDDGIKTPGSHSDTIQIRKGQNMLFHWNSITGACAPDSPERPGGVMDRCLQTGSLEGDIRAAFLNNWLDGGLDFCMAISSTAPPTVDYAFRRNRFGSRVTAPTTGTRTLPTSYDAGIRFDSTNVWDSTGSPV